MSLSEKPNTGGNGLTAFRWWVSVTLAVVLFVLGHDSFGFWDGAVILSSVWLVVFTASRVGDYVHRVGMKAFHSNVVEKTLWKWIFSFLAMVYLLLLVGFFRGLFEDRTPVQQENPLTTTVHETLPLPQPQLPSTQELIINMESGEFAVPTEIVEKAFDRFVLPHLYNPEIDTIKIHIHAMADDEPVSIYYKYYGEPLIDFVYVTEKGAFQYFSLKDSVAIRNNPRLAFIRSAYLKHQILHQKDSLPLTESLPQKSSWPLIHVSISTDTTSNKRGARITFSYHP